MSLVLTIFKLCQLSELAITYIQMLRTTGGVKQQRVSQNLKRAEVTAGDTHYRMVRIKRKPSEYDPFLGHTSVLAHTLFLKYL